MTARVRKPEYFSTDPSFVYGTTILQSSVCKKIKSDWRVGADTQIFTSTRQSVSGSAMLKLRKKTSRGKGE